MNHLVKVGLLGAVGCFRAVDRATYSRDTQVVCRTARGLEVGSVLCSVEEAGLEKDGDLLRGLGSEDHMIIERLNRFRDKAFQACSDELQKRSIRATLVDVEHLFDGESLYFYFLGDVDERLNALTDELAETYERKVRFKKFAEKLASGCGPGCGTSASKCSTGGCGSCALSGGCGSKK